MSTDKTLPFFHSIFQGADPDLKLDYGKALLHKFQLFQFFFLIIFM